MRAPVAATQRKAANSALFFAEARKDPIYKAIIGHLNKTRRNDSHMGVRIVGVKVFAKPKKHGSESRVKLTQRGRPAVKFNIRRRSPLPQEDQSPNMDVTELEVDAGGQFWQPFLQWIEMEYGARTDETYTLSHWWQSNARSFPFMDLPYELRIFVYEQLTGLYIWPHPALKSNKLNYFRPELYPEEQRANRPTVLGELYFRAPSGQPTPTPTQMPAVSKQVAAEFRDFIEKHTQPHFRFPRQLKLLLTNRKFTHSLRRISIGAPNWRLFCLLGYKSSLRRAFEPVQGETAHISMFRNIATLEHLNFHFQTCPLMIDRSKSPPDRFNWDAWHRVRSKESVLEASCQRVFVEWFLTFALDHIRHIRKVTLTGHVKDSTRRKWEEIFEEARAGTKHDMAAEKARIMALPVGCFPPACYCRHSCNWWKVHGPHPEGYVEPESGPHDLEYDPAKHDRFVCED